MKIAALTPEQLLQVPVWRDEWQRVEYGTAPADRRRAEAAISGLYRRSGARTPAFLWVDSPLSALLAIAALHQTGEHPALKYRSEDEMGHDNLDWHGGLSRPDEHAGRAVEYWLLQKLHNDLGGAFNRRSRVIWTAVRREVTRVLWTGPDERSQPGGDVIREQRWGALGDQLFKVFGDDWPKLQVRSAQFRTRLCRLLEDEFRKADPSWDGDPAWDDEPWLGRAEPLVGSCAVHKFCRDVIGVRYTDFDSEQIDLWSEATRSCGWWWPRQSICVVSERPIAVHRDDRERLHHPSEAAVKFRDGFEVHSWHGTEVPWWWIMVPENLDPRLALTWGDIEQRRVAAEMVGWKRVLELVNPRTIDRNDDPAIGELIEVTLPVPERFARETTPEGLDIAVPRPSDGRARFLRARCGTGREFVLSVPREMSTAREANAWTYGLSSTEYQLEVRT